MILVNLATINDWKSEDYKFAYQFLAYNSSNISSLKLKRWISPRNKPIALGG